MHQTLLQRPEINIGENLVRKNKKFLQMYLWTIPPEQGFTPDHTLGITGRPYQPIYESGHKESLSGTIKDDMLFNNSLEIMTTNNDFERMEYNTSPSP